ncbi:MAG: Sensory transduction histidine kinase [Clostridiales bacterium 38_11]|nr:MAG: Sensory transduction histidine kinase [Clostridiales bacterium 38_11]HBH12057.1 two-component sensor histidine kinase [Clostridiales bacterium]
MLSTYLLLILVLFFLLTTLIPQYIVEWQIEYRKNSLKTAGDEIGKRIDYYLGFYDSTIYTTYIDNVTRQYAGSLNSRVMIFDGNGRIISDSNNQFKQQSLDLPQIRDALEGRSTWNNYFFNDIGNVLYLAVPVFFDGNISGGVLIANSINDLYDNVDVINDTIKTIIFIVGVLITVGVAIISNHFLKPINKFYPVINKLAKGDFGDRVDVRSNDEFKMLANSFNSMSIKLDEVEQQREDFVGNVSHELKTPLASIKLLSESLLTQDKVEEKVYKEFLSDINNETDRLNSIVTELLSLVDLNKKHLVLEYEMTNLNLDIDKILDQLKPFADQKNIKIVFEELDNIMIRLDKNKIKQAIINIVHNAIVYSPEFGVVTVKLYKDRDQVVLEIEDTGYGIPKENIDSIFDRFYRVDKARSRNTGGTGLGLSISKQIVNLHNGSISVSSVLGVGSTFSIRLPIQQGV